MTTEAQTFPCPSCGFEVFSAPPGSYEICELCGWEDDHVQLRFPAMAGGANKSSLAEHQTRSVAKFPTNVSIAKGFRRSSEWRPLLAHEIVSAHVPASGMEYFDAASEEAPLYYWLRPQAP